MTEEKKEVKLTKEMWDAFGYYSKNWTYRRIADKMEMSVATAHLYVKNVLESLLDERQRFGMAYIQGEVSKLDEMLDNLSVRLEEPSDDEAKELALKIMERRSKLLGLDRPIKQEHSGNVTLEMLMMKPSDVPKEPNTD